MTDLSNIDTVTDSDQQGHHSSEFPATAGTRAQSHADRQRIFTHIEDAILHGAFGDAGRMPTERALAKQFISQININAFTSSVGDIFIDKPYQDLDFSKTESNIVRCPDESSAEKMISRIQEIRKAGDTIGGTITCVAQNVPVGLGEPVFHKLHAQLGAAMLSINAVKGFEFGSGFCGAKMKGSEHNDIFNADGSTQSNLSGGIQGGISNGMDIYFRVAFKPVATIMSAQQTINSENEVTEITGKGRHDPCVVPRAVPIIEAMTALVLADYWLLNKTRKLDF